MYGYKWLIDENGIFKLDVTNRLQKEIRPVFKEELDFFELNKVWEYPNTDSPILWAEGVRRYILNGECIAEAKGGGFYTKPKIDIKNINIKSLIPINVEKLILENQSVLDGLVQRSINFIRTTYENYTNKGYKFIVAFSGGKDSLVLLDLVQRALSPDQFVVIFVDTGMELSDTYYAVEKAKKHWPHLNFQTAKSIFTAEESWREFGPPGRRLRWCCSVHKSVPLMLLLSELFGPAQIKAVVFDGVRAEESDQRSTYLEISEGHKHINQVNCRPILDWNSAELYTYIFERNILLNQAYKYGMSRVGCAVCPMSSGWRDIIAIEKYSDNVNPLLKIVENYAERNKGKNDVKKYIEGVKWGARMGGDGLPNGTQRVNELIENNEIKFVFIERSQEWIDVSRIIGPIIERSNNNGEQIIRNLSFYFNINDDGSEVTYGPYDKMDRYVISWLRSVANKVAYCIGCKTCMIECPSSAFNINENRKIEIKIDKCVYCGNCLSKIDKGCKVAQSLHLSGGGNMVYVGMDRYCTFGFRESFLEHFYELQNDCWSSKVLGNKQYDSLRRYLKDSELIYVNPQTNKNGQITALGKKLIEIGLYHPFVWAVIWTNLAYNSPLMKWYILHVKLKEIYEKADLIFLIGDTYSEKQRENSVSSLGETFTKSPIGNTLEMGVPIPMGNSYKYYKKGWTTPIAEAILYALFVYAEKLDGHYDFTLKELASLRVKRPEHFIGMDPVVIFGLEESLFKSIVKDLANAFPEFISISFVADLDNIKLNSSKTSLDVVDLVLGD